MEVQGFLESLRRDPRYRGQIVHVRRIPARSGLFADPKPPLPRELAQWLQRQGVERLYSHQVACLETARRGGHWVVVSGTASGKTLCYNLPVLEVLCREPDACALYLFPTKALARDQLKALQQMVPDGLWGPDWAGVYDGDTPVAQRRRLRASARLLITNPDMLHSALLPYHPKWSRLLGRLRYIVLDEVHTYCGILGAHVGNVLRRLWRVCRHYGARPQVLAASATVANPGELVRQLAGQAVEVIAEDGSPRGTRYFVLWDPAAGAQRRTATDDAVWLMSAAIQQGAQTLAFTRTRQAAELVYRYTREVLLREAPGLAEKVSAYRGGYLPQERRRIERDLATGRLRGITSTNALELGIDIGSLDATLLVHYPGTIASTWQQAGRSGRRREESLSVLIAGGDPIDRFLLRHPEYLFERSPEHAVADPDNPHVVRRHVHAATFELPISREEVDSFGPHAQAELDGLSAARAVTLIDGKWYFAGTQSPAHQTSLRHMSDHTFAIVQRDGSQHRVIAQVDAISAPELVYPQAVYLHQGETYLVRDLDWEGKVAYVERQETDYYTQAILESRVRITSRDAVKPHGAAGEAGYGRVEVFWKTIAFKKIQFATRDNVGYGTVDLPGQELSTTGFWLAPEPFLGARLARNGYRLGDALCGLRNLAIVALSVVAMCDSRDISGVVDSSNLGRPAMILYDRYPGGLGYCQRGWQEIGQLLTVAWQIIASCPCRDGCPGCVGLPNLRPAIHSDPDLTRGYPVPDKAATLALLQPLVAGEEKIPAAS